MSSNKYKLSKRLFILFKGRYPVNAHQEESITVKALKKQLRIMGEIVDSQAEQISRQGKEISKFSESSSQDKIIDMVGQFLTGKQSPSPPEQRTLITETGSTIEQKDLSDDQIKSIIDGYDKDTIKKGLVLGEDFLANKIREHYPTISENSIKRGLDLAKKL